MAQDTRGQDHRHEVSVLLPVKNGMPGLRESIEALASQSYEDFVLLVQDSMSDDGSREFLESVDVPFDMEIETRQDRSLTEGYDRCFQRCTSRLAVATACDEVLDADALQQYVSWVEQEPQAACIYSGMRLVDEAGRLLQEFQPPEFDLLDFLRHRMCPTWAGILNCDVIGEELHLDLSLDVVPDFEFRTRLALRYGSHSLVRRQALTMTARADDTSMTYRPSAQAAIAAAKQRVFDRLLHGDLRESFSRYLEKDLSFNLHLNAAQILWSTSGDSDEFRAHVLAADAYDLNRQAVDSLAHGSHGMDRDSSTGRLHRRHDEPPAIPPSDELVVFDALPATSLESQKSWQSQGAHATNIGADCSITTPDAPWSYAAIAPLPHSDLDFDAHWMWVRIEYSSVSGVSLLSLADPSSNVVEGERALSATSSPATEYLCLFRDSPTFLLVRNSGTASAATVIVHSIAVVGQPKSARG